MNIDETPLRIVRADKFTLEVAGAKQVQLMGKEDKREITILLSCTLGESLLPLS